MRGLCVRSRVLREGDAESDAVGTPHKAARGRTGPRPSWADAGAAGKPTTPALKASRKVQREAG